MEPVLSVDDEITTQQKFNTSICTLKFEEKRNAKE